MKHTPLVLLTLLVGCLDSGLLGVLEPETGDSATGDANETSLDKSYGSEDSTLGSSDSDDDSMEPVVDCPTPPAFIDLDAQMQLMAEDILTVDEGARTSTRYITLTHLTNGGYTCAQLEPWREAVRLAVNALSTEPTLVRPIAVVGSFETIYRIDIRNYGWDRSVTTTIDTSDPLEQGLRDEAITFSDKWDLLAFDMLTAYVPDAELGDGAAGVLRVETGQSIFSLMGDELAYRALQPPTVHDVLELPLTIQGTDVMFLRESRSESQLERKVVRAARREPGGALAHRLVERFEQPNGRFYWVTYDFGTPSEGARNLFANPMGPADPFSAIVPDETRFFQEDVGQALIQLPNGLMTSLLYTSPSSSSAGHRLNKAPTDIAADPRSPDGRLLNSMSCFSCHRNGLIAMEDELRPSVESDPTFADTVILDLVRELHPEPADFREMIQNDTDSYLQAKQELGIAPDRELDPIEENFRFYTFADLPLALAMSELGRNDDALSQCLLVIDEWNTYLAPGTTQYVPRDVFDRHYGDCIELLGLGLPVASLPLEDL